MKFSFVISFDVKPIRERSNIILRFEEGGGCLNRHMVRESWPNRHITFIVAEKAYFTVPLALFTVYWGEGVGRLKTSYRGGGDC